MEKFLDFLRKTNLPKEKELGGFFIGEKVLYSALLDRAVFLCGDFVSASKLKKGLSDCGKKAAIISCGRENEDEMDANLFPFAENVSLFLEGKIDYLIFLPSSLTTKFDFKFLKKKFDIFE